MMNYGLLFKVTVYKYPKTDILGKPFKLISRLNHRL